MGLVWPDQCVTQRSTALEASSLTITKPTRFETKDKLKKNVYANQCMTAHS